MAQVLATKEKTIAVSFLGGDRRLEVRATAIRDRVECWDIRAGKMKLVQTTNLHDGAMWLYLATKLQDEVTLSAWRKLSAVIG